MSLGWMLLGLCGWALGVVFVVSLLNMSGDEDKKARRAQRRVDAWSKVATKKQEDE